MFTALYDGSVNGWGSFGYTLDNAAPLLIVAVGHDRQRARRASSTSGRKAS